MVEGDAGSVMVSYETFLYKELDGFTTHTRDIHGLSTDVMFDSTTDLWRTTFSVRTVMLSSFHYLLLTINIVNLISLVIFSPFAEPIEVVGITGRQI